MTRQPTHFVPDWASPPGETLADLLEERSMTQTNLAERLGVSLKHVNRVVKGAASISAELALGLERVLGAPASFWMTREAHYQASQARQQQRREFAGAVTWAKRFPLAELRKRGYVGKRSQGAELVEELLAFFGIAHPSQWQAPEVAYRKSQKFESDSYALSAWLREGELQAKDIEGPAYDEKRFEEVLQEVRGLTAKNPDRWWPKLQELCGAAGVAVVIVNAYKGAKANGATHWLSPDQPLVQLSLRHRWEDIFWFTFFHESGHVLLHRKRDLFIEEKNSPTDPTEERLEGEADRFAAKTLIPPPYDQQLAAIDPNQVAGFARSIGVGAAIVIGRMQHEKLIPFSHGNQHRRTLELVDD